MDSWGPAVGRREGTVAQAVVAVDQTNLAQARPSGEVEQLLGEVGALDEASGLADRRRRAPCVTSVPRRTGWPRGPGSRIRDGEEPFPPGTASTPQACRVG